MKPGTLFIECPQQVIECPQQVQFFPIVETAKDAEPWLDE
jgi:hypothetical protein